MAPPRPASVAELHALLDAPVGSSDDIAGDHAWLEALLRWVLGRDRLASIGRANPAARLALVTSYLDQHPRREQLVERMSAVWKHTSAVRLLSEMGLPDHTSFLKEATQRITDRVVPQLDAEDDLYALVNRLQLTEDDARFVEGLPQATRQRWAPVFEPSPGSLATAAQLLAVRAAAVGLSRDLLEHQPGVSELDSPFFSLLGAVRGFAERPDDPAARAAWVEARLGCNHAVQRALSRLDRRGVSVDLVYRLDLVRAMLQRIEVLLLRSAGRGDGLALAMELVRGSATQRSLRGLLRTTLRRLALKVVEHTAQTGEHYIASNRAEWWAMLRSASGGGALTSFTAFFKYGLAALPLAPALVGAAHALNYSASFIAMQLLGFSLASKQPAMTGAALADALDQDGGLGAEIELVASIARTQLIAAVGNVCVTIPGALLLDAGWRLLSGHPLLSVEAAHHGLSDLDPLRSLTLPFAAITGVFLWMSSLAAGLGANWSAFRALPEAVARNPRIGRWLGQPRARWLGRQVGRHFSGIVGYLVLGLLLGFVPVLFQFAGIGLEVRHVTLSSAAMALDASALWAARELHAGPLVGAGLGIVAIGALNFGVSFALALRVALQARGLLAASRRRLLRGILSALLRTPGRFLFPPRATPVEPQQPS